LTLPAGVNAEDASFGTCHNDWVTLVPLCFHAFYAGIFHGYFYITTPLPCGLRPSSYTAW
jgi:hypothetical protein